MLYAALKLLHLGAIVVWVGGMVFAHFFLRPALAALEPPQRLRLMQAVLGRFFAAVTVAVALALASGAWMIGDVHQRVAATGGQLVLPIGWTLMTLLGLVMTGIFGFIRLVPYRRLQSAVADGAWPAAAAALAQIRRWVVVNLFIGGVVIAVAVLGGA